MTLSRWLSTFALSTSLFAAACVADSDDTIDQTEQSAPDTRVHMLPLHDASKVSDAIQPAITAHLNYYGGPVLKNVNVYPVFWNSSTKLQPNINAFYPAVVGGSPLYAMLNQYSGIGSGTASAGYVDSNATKSVRDSAVQSRLNTLFSQNKLPAPSANNYYPVHFPSGMTITAPDGSRSCVVFCAYHGTYVRNGVNVNYGIIPDIGQSGCNGGCGGSTVTNNTDSVASHELVEATTDPAVGLATVYGPPLAWYDPNNGEIGDICNANQGSTAGFTVQKEWSNAANACVDH
jgi:hypothetical protein